MTERMKLYRQRIKEKGLVQVRVWVSEEHRDFITYMAGQCRPQMSEPQIKERYGRPATPIQIRLAKSLATTHGKKPPEHLYDYHISLAGWMWAHGGKPIKD